MKALKELVRPTIWALKPYSSARDEYKGVEASVFLDANENPYNMPFNRYPDPLQQDVKNLLAPIKGVRQDQIFLGNGSDEAIDVLFRVFCEPAIDNVVAIAPTYGMYEVCADINNIAYRTVLLDASYGLNAQMILEAVDRHTKMLFLCSPNNPSGNDLDRDEMIRLIENFDGIIVIDEAYSDFSAQRPFRLDLDKYPNIVVLNTFSKAWGCAAIRLGMAFASPDIIAMMNKVKYPYNVNLLTQQAAISILENYKEVEAWIQKLCETRTKLMDGFSQLPCCEFLYPSNANFFLAKMTDACGIYDYLVRHGIIVRNRHHVVLCGNCLRITIGTDDENEILLDALKQYKG